MAGLPNQAALKPLMSVPSSESAAFGATPWRTFASGSYSSEERWVFQGVSEEAQWIHPPLTPEKSTFS